MIPKGVYEFDDFRLDPGKRTLTRGGQAVPLCPRALDVLAALVQQPGSLVTKEDLLRAVWLDKCADEGNLTQHVSLVRKALGMSPGGHDYIETVPKSGYRFAAEVKTKRGRGWSPRIAALTLVVCLACLAGYLIVARHPTRNAPRKVRSVAVLPFVNMSPDADIDHFSDGLTEELIQMLGAVESLRVPGRTSAFQFKGKVMDIREIGKRLGVEAILEGSIRKDGNKFRITAQLNRVADGYHLWSATYDREISSVLAVQSEIGRAILASAGLDLDGTPNREVFRTGTVNPEAYAHYQRGRLAWNRRTEGAIRRAISSFEKAIELDPNYAPAYAGLADCYNQLGTVLIGARPPSESRPLAIAAARRALAIDPELAEAHAALAYARLFDWDWQAAEEGLRRSLQLNASYPQAHQWYAFYLAFRGRGDEAVAEIRKAEELDPLSLIVKTQVGWILHFDRRYDEAIEQFRTVLTIDPNYLWGLWQLGMAYAQKSRFQESIDALERAVELSNRSPSVLGTLCSTYAEAGRKADSLRLLREMFEIARTQYVPAASFVGPYMALGDHDRAFAWLEKAYLERSNMLACIGAWPKVDPLRSDKRFHDLLRRTGLSPM
ncbi:MAG: winged helix-turn-helix domain-containing protein [Bryobacterales bacterium]|nr:winged helix-turn-helix domain-containing protein [Bryobacterales bacterium]